MNITFLLGNGFDIGLGLHTSYENFYDRYCKPAENDSENIASFKKMLRERNEKSDDRIIDWSDFEQAFGDHSDDFYLDDKQLYIERFEHFVTMFNAYLEEESKNIDFSDTEKIGQMMKRAVDTYYHIRSEDEAAIQSIYDSADGDLIYNFVSFNYTSCVDKCAAALKEAIKDDKHRRVGQVLHVHGYIENSMIMGVNDAQKIKNIALAEDPEIKSEIIKPQQNIEARTGFDQKTAAVIANSDIICIYGMSLGATDRIWWERIADWLSRRSARALVILKHDPDYNLRFIFRQKLIGQTITKFLSCADFMITPDYISIVDKVYAAGNHDVFAMNLRKKQPELSGDIRDVFEAMDNTYPNALGLMDNAVLEYIDAVNNQPNFVDLQNVLVNPQIAEMSKNFDA